MYKSKKGVPVVSNSNGLALFTSSINQLIESPLIMVNKQIANLLQTVTRVPALMKTLQETVKTSSYATEFSRAKVTLTRPDGTLECKLKLPTEQTRLFTFVVCLLMQVDSAKLNFIDFLKEYFYQEDSNDSYALFVAEVLKPFKQAGESLLYTQDPYSLDAENVERAEKYFYAERSYISTEALRQALSLVQDVRQAIDQLDFACEEDRIDAVTICNAMSNALHLKNARILSFVWIGFKNTFRHYQTVQICVEQLAKLLQENVQS